MTWVAALAPTANVMSALVLFRFREVGANVRSVWICSRNDAIGNVAVVVAAGAVWLTGSGWPDVIVAAALAGLFLRGAVVIAGQGGPKSARSKSPPPNPPLNLTPPDGFGHGARRWWRSVRRSTNHGARA